MYNLNEVNLIGYVGGNPEVIKLKDNTEMVKFSVATSDKWKDKQGKEVKSTQWHSITAFGPVCGIIKKYVSTGTLVYIKGKLKYSKVEAPEQETKYYTDIICQEFIILKGGKVEIKEEVEEKIPTDDNLKNQSETKKNVEPDDIHF